jgi:hypothetical protein
MAVIKSGSSTDQWEIDPTSKAGRVTLYAPDGTLSTFPLSENAATETTLAAIKAQTDQLSFASSKLKVTTDGALTDTELRASNVPVSVSNFPVTQPVSIAASVAVTGPLTDAQLRASVVPVSTASLPLPSGASTESTLSSILTELLAKTEPANQQHTIVDAAPAASQGVTATGAAAVTLTLPAVPSQFHYITLIEIEAYSSSNRTGVATPILVTTTNLPGTPAFTFATAGAIGTTDTKVYVHAQPFRSVTVNTATTIVCPATAGVIWRVNVWYQAAV